MNWSLVVWAAAAGVLGFAISAVFAAGLKLSRNRFLIPYVTLAGIFLYAFSVIHHIEIGTLIKENWQWGMLTGALVSVFLVKNVKSQPASRRSKGAELVFDVGWPGLVYGITDALFLNVMPVTAVFLATSQLPWAESVSGKAAVAVLALLASLWVTLAYHLGYPEFRSKRVIWVLAGNSLITLAYLVSGSPLGSILSHPVMHIAAVLQGAETTIQLPPHYSSSLKVG